MTTLQTLINSHLDTFLLVVCALLLYTAYFLVVKVRTYLEYMVFLWEENDKNIRAIEFLRVALENSLTDQKD